MTCDLQFWLQTPAARTSPGVTFAHAVRTRAFAAVLACVLIGSGAAGVGRAQQNGISQRASDGAGPKSDASMAIVVFNENDPDSEPLARYYAERRGIAKDHLVGLKCTTAEEISREEYDRDIAGPLRQIFESRGWWRLRAADDPAGRVEATTIHFVAVMRGLPLRIAQTANYPGDSPNGPPAIAAHNEAAVDSEIAALGLFSSSISGVTQNPYFRSFTRIEDARIPALLLVGRLDGPTPETVRRMVVDSIMAEREGLHGFAYIDARGTKDPGLKEGDTWLFKLAAEARKNGIPVILDSGEGVFPPAYPMRDAALYFGWYTENVSGPMARPDFQFTRGAVAVHIHSFSAVSLRDSKKFWCAPLLAAGAAATLGNVAEPYLALTPQLDVFYDRLRAGFTLAESAWASELAISWMTTCVGDPLYRPFPVDFTLEKASAEDDWLVYAAGANAWLEDTADNGSTLVKTAEARKSGVIFEGLGLLQIVAGQVTASIESFAKARKFYENPEDQIRVTIHEVIQLRGLGRASAALGLTRKILRQFPNATASEVLKAFESEMAPPPAAPAKN